MRESELLEQIGKKEADKEQLAQNVINEPGLLSVVLEGLDADNARIKYGCAKVLRIISERAPGILYPRFDFFASLIDSDNTFLKWGAIHILANLATIDSEGEFEGVFDKYFAPLPGPVVITAANVIGGAAKVALAKPMLTEEIAKELLKVENATYQTIECRNIALGHAIKSFDLFFDQIIDKEPVLGLIKRQLTNTRNSTQTKAEGFAKKHRIAPL